MGKLRVLDLFSGIGGFSLGLEKTGGFETVAFCEIEPFSRKVLKKHWPDVPCFEDVRKLTKGDIDGSIDVICGGFPCQDISNAGRGDGIAGTRSGLWKEYSRLIGELRPKFVIVENVAALLARGLDVVLGDLAALGYNAEWHCIPASAVGAPHRRDRIWIVAYPHDDGQHEAQNTKGDKARNDRSQAGANEPFQPEGSGGMGQNISRGKPEVVADAYGQRLQGRAQNRDVNVLGARINEQLERCINVPGGIWPIEPDVGRVAHGVPNRVDRLKSLGNAVVPQIPEIIGRAILEVHNAKT